MLYYDGIIIYHYHHSKIVYLKQCILTTLFLLSTTII
nr:MAG TPA: hypothetical protein [Caudoviricetes sp.]